MVQKVRVKVTNGNKKSWVEVCKWSCKLEDVLQNLDAEDEEHQELQENLKLEADDKWIEMTEEVGWRWGEGSIVLTKEEYDNFDWDNKDDNFCFYDFEDAEFYESNDGCWTDIAYTNLHEDADAIDEDILYDLVRDYGDCEECEIFVYGPIEHEIEEEFEEE